MVRGAMHTPGSTSPDDARERRRRHSTDKRADEDAYTSPVAASPGPAQTIGFSAYWPIIWSRKWVVLLSMAVALCAAVAVDQVRTKEYSATSSVLFVSQNFAGTTTLELTPQDIATQIRVVQSEPVRRIAATLLEAAPPSPGVAQVGTTATANITVTSRHAAFAAKAANAFAAAYIAYSKDRFLAQEGQAEAAVQAQIAALQRQITSLQRQILVSRPAVVALLTGQLGTIAAQQAALRTQLIQIQTDAAQAPTGGVVLQPAAIPGSPSSPRLLLDLLIAAVLGLLVGIGLALLLALRDDRIKTHRELQLVAGELPILGVIPEIVEWTNPEIPILSTTEHSSTPVAEAYRGLRTSVEFALQDQGIRLIEVTSPLDKEGKTTVAANLAAALAQAGATVLLVGCDLHNPRVHAFFSVSNDVGLTSVLSGTTTLDEACVDVPGVDNLSLLPSGPPPRNPSELLAARHSRDLLQQLAQRYDYVVMDGPPLLPVSDAVLLATISSGVLIVCAAGQTTKGDFQRGNALLRSVDSPVLGAVLNKASHSDVAVSDRYDGRYGRYGGDDTPPAARSVRSGGTTRGASSMAALLKRPNGSPPPARSYGAVVDWDDYGADVRTAGPANGAPGGDVRRTPTPQ
jgi:capsular exopolysaccharide synthesis family protein